MISNLDGLLTFATVALFFLLRIGIPILAIAGLALWLRRMDRHWQAQADVEHRHALEIAPALVPHPVAGVPCWEQRNCPEEQRSHCTAFAHPAAPCWLSRQASEGSLPRACTSCGIYTTRTQALPVPVTAGRGFSAA